MTDFNEQIIEEFRANNGNVQTAGFGSNLILVHSIGAKSGTERVHPLMGIAQPDGSWFIAASKGGAPENPAWFANLLAHPETTVETPAENGTATVEVVASVLGADERDSAWAQFTSRSPGFAEYEAKAGGRTIPVVKLTPRS
ncbi:nitroreductase family deazaflavin-dependent oxidoreductase [Subtercola sp. PAMC28395]|uniref:nitroreductase/quinone reductase family protein n=1 Tax=Subtercola sp. PAMC28395 TaxID=2846775 RepID=UPI001C0DA628|nr:nitroreductase/quinone reductase family protein [Subtercola sp. PAMC28395]QWT22681.1 nitroreductase family deazaflavin-dependent oxidoreductase [Subtercola sp. PAMC28395]